MGAACSIARVASFVAFGAAVARGVVSASLDSVVKAVEAVRRYLRVVAVASSACMAFVKDKPVGDMGSSAMDHLRRVASSAFESLKAAAAFVKDSVIMLMRHLRGDKEADAARGEVNRARRDDVLGTALARVAAGFGQLQGVKALPPPSSSCVVSAARRASEMMDLVKTVVWALGDSIPEEASASGPS